MRVLLASSALVACGAPAPAPGPATPRPVDATSPPPAKEAPAAATDETAAPSEEATTDAAPLAKGLTGKEPTEEKLRASKALDEPFPEVEEVIKEIGAPFATGKTTRREWWFEKKPLKKTFSCETIDLIRGPSGRVIIDTSVYTGDECKTVSVKKATVFEVLATLAGEKVPADPILQLMTKGVDDKTFDEASALFEKKLGKPRLVGEPNFSAWRYVDEGGECRVLLLTFHLNSGASQAIWSLPCD